MTNRTRRPRLTAKAVAAAKPRDREHILWDGTLAHFGVRVQPTGVKSFIVQTRVNGRMRKLTLGRFPEMGVGKARREAAALLARLSGGEPVASPRKTRVPVFRDFASRYRERRKHRWKASSLKTFDGYLRHRLMPAFGRMRLDAIDHRRAPVRNPQPRMGRNRRTWRARRERTHRRLQDRAAHGLARPGGGTGARGAAAGERGHAGVPRSADVEPALHVLGEHPG